MSARPWRHILWGVLVWTLSALAVADIRFRNFEDPDEPKWQEDESLVLPAFPQDGHLAEYYVSAVATNRYFVDTRSIAPGKDKVVRYTLVVRTSGGATNVTHEGMRCETLQFKIYAMGRPDGTWSMARRPEWRSIENKLANRHHAALSKELFCPMGNPIESAAEGIEALRLGKNPRVQ